MAATQLASAAWLHPNSFVEQVLPARTVILPASTYLHPAQVMQALHEADYEAPAFYQPQLQQAPTWRYQVASNQHQQHKNKQPVQAPISRRTVNGILSLVLLFAVSICGCIGSIFIMSALTVIESLQTRGNCYLVSLALAHLLVTLIVIPSSALQIMAGEGINERRLCHYQWLTLEFSLIVSQLSFLLIAADNYLGGKCSERLTASVELASFLLRRSESQPNYQPHQGRAHPCPTPGQPPEPSEAPSSGQAEELHQSLLMSAPATERDGLFGRLISRFKGGPSGSRLPGLVRLERPGLAGYRNCCGRFKVLLWILLVWSVALAYTLHQHEVSYGPTFCTARSQHHYSLAARRPQPFNQADGPQFEPPSHSQTSPDGHHLGRRHRAESRSRASGAEEGPIQSEEQLDGVAADAPARGPRTRRNSGSYHRNQPPEWRLMEAPAGASKEQDNCSACGADKPLVRIKQTAKLQRAIPSDRPSRGSRSIAGDGSERPSGQTVAGKVKVAPGQRQRGSVKSDALMNNDRPVRGRPSSRRYNRRTQRSARTDFTAEPSAEQQGNKVSSANNNVNANDRLQRPQKQQQPSPADGSLINNSSSANRHPSDESGGALRARPRFFWLMLTGTIILPSLLSSLLFARAYLMMKEFRTRAANPLPSNLVPVGLQSVLTNSTLAAPTPVLIATPATPSLKDPYSAREPLAPRGAGGGRGRHQKRPANAELLERRQSPASARPRDPFGQQSQQPPRRQLNQVMSAPTGNERRVRAQSRPARPYGLGPQPPDPPPDYLRLEEPEVSRNSLHSDTSFSAPPSATLRRECPKELFGQPADAYAGSGQHQSGGDFEFGRHQLHAQSFHYGSQRRLPSPPGPQVEAQRLSAYEQQQHLLERHRSLPHSSRLYQSESGRMHLEPVSQRRRRDFLPGASPEKDPVTAALADVIKSMEEADSSDASVSRRLSEARSQPAEPASGKPLSAGDKRQPAEGSNKAILCTYAYMTNDQLLKSNIVVFVLNLTLWLPLVVLTVVSQYRDHLTQELKDGVWWMATLNCCSCSYVYALTNKDFREAFNKLFYYCCCKSHVTFQRKGPVFRRQLDLDGEGNLRVHIVPGLNAHSGKLADDGSPLAAFYRHANAYNPPAKTDSGPLNYRC